MRYFPINLDIRNKPVTIVGGGQVATRKARCISKAGGIITVIAPTISLELKSLCKYSKERIYMKGDLNGAYIVIAATDNPSVNTMITADAAALGLLINRTDKKDSGNFTTPAVITRGDVIITVSTGGKSPALAQRIKEDIEKQIGEEYAEAARILGLIREKLLTDKGKSAYNDKDLSELVRLYLPQLLNTSHKDELDDLLRKLFGNGFILDPKRSEEKDIQ
jgi:precorrin-2 dehydrogenase/sirohydrochlorin ferrochelatase